MRYELDPSQNLKPIEVPASHIGIPDRNMKTTFHFDHSWQLHPPHYTHTHSLSLSLSLILFLPFFIFTFIDLFVYLFPLNQISSNRSLPFSVPESPRCPWSFSSSISRVYLSLSLSLSPIAAPAPSFPPGAMSRQTTSSAFTKSKTLDNKYVRHSPINSPSFLDRSISTFSVLCFRNCAKKKNAGLNV